MSKKLLRTVGKIAAVVATVAAIGTGIGAVLGGTMMLAIGGMSIAASAIAGAASLISIGASMLTKPKSPQIGNANEERLTASLNVRTPRVMAFGRTALATDLRDQEFTGGGKEYLHRFFVVAAHRINSVQEIWFDDKKAWTLAGGVQGEFAGYLDVTVVLEGGPANAITISPRMGSTRRFTGLAYVYMRYKLTGNDKKTDGPFSQQVPTRLTIVGEAIPCYDARQDSTRGGVGAHRAEDQTTWTYGEHARNPANQLATYLLGWKIQNPQNGTWKLSVGKGIPPDRIDWSSFIDAANLCDEPVALATGGTEPRYRGDGLVNEADDPTFVVDAFKSAMNADLDDQDGLLRLTVFHNDLATPDADFTTADIEDDYQWLQTPPLNESFNVVRGTYVEPDPKSLYQPNEYREVVLASPDGIERVHPADFGLVQSKSQAERLAKQRLQRQQYGGTFRATFLAAGWKVHKNSVVRLSFEPEGWVNKLFRVAEYEGARPDGRVPMTLREEHADIYAWDAEESPAVQIAEPAEYAAGDAPIAQFLGTIAEGADVTSEGIAAGIVNQAPAATDPTIEPGATVGATAGTNLKDSGGQSLTDGHIKNVQQKWSEVNDDNGGLPDDGADVTGVNTAAAIFGQTDWATYSTLAPGTVAAKVSLLRPDGLMNASDVILEGNNWLHNVFPSEFGANKTEGRVAAGFVGQDVLATRSTVEDTHLGGFLANRLKGNPIDFNYLATDRVIYADGTALEGRKPAELGANVTETRVASAVAGQSAWATEAALTPTTVSGRTSRLRPDGYVNADVVLLEGINFLHDVFPGELGANKTETRIASAVAGQSAWATTTLTIDAITKPGSNRVYNGSLKLGSSGWTLIGCSIDPNEKWLAPNTTPAAAWAQYANTELIYVGTGSTITLSAEVFRYLTDGALLYLSFYNDAAEYVTDLGAGTDGIGWRANQTWQRLDFTCTAPSNYVRVIYMPGTLQAGGYFLARKIKVESGSVATPFSDEATNSAVYRDMTAVDALKPQELGSNKTETRIAASIAGQAPAATDSTIEASADVTKVATGPVAAEVNYDSGGTLTDTMPKTVPGGYKLTPAGGSHLTSGVTWAAAIESGSFTGAAPSTSVTSGVGSLILNSDPSTPTVSVLMTPTYGGKTYPPVRTPVSKKTAAATGGGSGTSFNTGAISGGFNSTSFVAVTPEIPVTMAAPTATVQVTSSTLTPYPGSNGSTDVIYKAQWWNGSAWADLGSSTSSPDPNIIGGEIIEGSISLTATKTGLTVGTLQKFRIVAAINGGVTRIITPGGSASVQG